MIIGKIVNQKCFNKSKRSPSRTCKIWWFMQIINHTSNSSKKISRHWQYRSTILVILSDQVKQNIFINCSQPYTKSLKPQTLFEWVEHNSTSKYLSGTYIGIMPAASLNLPLRSQSQPLRFELLWARVLVYIEIICFFYNYVITYSEFVISFTDLYY